MKKRKISKEEQREIIEKILENEPEKIQKEVRRFFERKLKTRDFSVEEIIWEIEEIAGDLHGNIKREFPLGKFKDFKEAQAWAVERNGVCRGKIEKWLISYDPIKDKKIKELKKKEKR